MDGTERMRGNARQRGVVLLSVLLILALLTALTYQMVGRQSLVVAQARQTFGGDQALAYALGLPHHACSARASCARWLSRAWFKLDSRRLCCARSRARVCSTAAR